MKRYLSVCSGIESATVAWHPLGWVPVAFAERDAFPSAVLAHHYGSNMPGQALSHNTPPNLGDITHFQEWPDLGPIDILVGGTPCQSFSIAGLRAGLVDPRGNLALTYLAIADRYKPAWLVWENVPGVLSSDGGRDFGSILRGMVELGYHVAYRVLDAQYVRIDGLGRAVPQRRRRVFVVGYLGDWRRAAAALFDAASLCGDSPPRREAGQKAAGTLGARTSGGGGLGTDFDLDGGLQPVWQDEIARCDTAGYAQRLDFETENFVAHALRAQSQSAHAADLETYVPVAIQGSMIGRSDYADPQGMGVDASGAMSTLDTKNPHAVAFRTAGDGGVYESGDVVAALTTGTDASANVICFDETQITSLANRSSPKPGDASHPLSASARPPTIANTYAVRRLTPLECERLQGFPDGYTSVPYRGKTAADAPRYKALGNSMAVNCMRWIGRRIQMVEALA